MTDLRVGLIGLGAMGRNHARILTELPGINFIGITDPIHIQDIQPQFSSIKVYKDLKELLSQSLDYCVIAAPTGSHKDLAIQALLEGVHCLIEKPVAIDYKESLQIQVVSERESLIVGVGHIERYNAAIRELKTRPISYTNS